LGCGRFYINHAAVSVGLRGVSLSIGPMGGLSREVDLLFAAWSGLLGGVFGY
jgi:hypothetical protein